MEQKTVWLDMDGTFANLYGVEGWLEDLQNESTRPYAMAKPMYNMREFRELLIDLKDNGYKVGIISWLSKNGSKEYNREVRRTKREWLNSVGLLDVFDHVRITPYGVKKSTTCKKYGYGILVDDEEQNRKAWKNGRTINANKNIMVELGKLI